MEGKGSPCQNMVQEDNMVSLYLVNNRKGKIRDKLESDQGGRVLICWNVQENIQAVV